MDRFRFDQNADETIDFNVLDRDGAAIAATDVEAIALTLYDIDFFPPGASPIVGVINDRYQQNVLNTNGVTVSDSTPKVFTWDLDPADNGPLLDEATLIDVNRKEIWRHRAYFQITLTGGALVVYECEIEVNNLRVP